jgi:hypothetical protein
MTNGSKIEESKRHWKLLQMRGLLNPNQRKKAISSKLPRFTQIGQIVDGHNVATSPGSVTDFGIEDALRTKFKASYHKIQREKADGGKLYLRSKIQKKHGRRR